MKIPAPHTDYVATRWYRAPELIMRCNKYDMKVDMFALGTIWAELYMLRPLFPGKNLFDQMNRVCKVLGTPSQNDWPDGYKQAEKMKYKFPDFVKVPLSYIIPNAPPEAIELIDKLLSYKPCDRPTAEECLASPYFKNVNEADIYRNIKVTTAYRVSETETVNTVKLTDLGAAAPATHGADPLAYTKQKLL